MKYLKSHRIYESKRSAVQLFKALKNAFIGTVFEIRFTGQDNDYVEIGVGPDSVFYDWATDDFNEDEIISVVEDHADIDYPESVPQSVIDNYNELDKIILDVVDRSKKETPEWWEEYVDSDVADSKVYDILKKNLPEHPDWIMKPKQVEGFFQDVIDDIDEDKYHWEFEIGMIFQNKITWAYKLNFRSEIDLGRDNYTKSLSDFNTLLSSVYRACKRIEQEENIHTYVDVTGNINGNQAIQARIYTERELIHGKIIDLVSDEDDIPVRPARRGPG